MSVSRNSAYNLAGALTPIALALVTVPIYLKLVGPDRYGVLAIAWLLLGYFGMFDLGLGRATAQRIASLRNAEPADRASAFWTALGVNCVMGFVGALIFWPVAYYLFAGVFKVDESLRPEIVAAVPLLALAVPIATTTGVLTGALQGRERFLEANMVSVTSTALFQLLPLLIAWLYGPYLPVLLLAAVCARIGGAYALWRKCRTDLARGYPAAMDRKQVRPLLSYGGWVMATALIGPMLVISDRFLIGATLGAVAVAHYTVVFQLAERISVIPAAITNALFPRLTNTRGAEEEQLGMAATRTMLAIMTPIILAGLFILEPFLNLWVGSAIAAEVALVGKLLFLSYWGNALGLVPYTRLQAGGRPDLVAKVLAVQVPFYLPALYVALNQYSLVGAAAVFLARVLLDYALLCVVGRWVPAPRATLLCGASLALALAVSELDVLGRTSQLALGFGLLLLSLSAAAVIAPDVVKERVRWIWQRLPIRRSPAGS
jgi:O-antigen/teichoic acid export membrane protein